MFRFAPTLETRKMEQLLEYLRFAAGEQHSSPSEGSILGRLKFIEENNPLYISRSYFAAVAFFVVEFLNNVTAS